LPHDSRRSVGAGTSEADLGPPRPNRQRFDFTNGTSLSGQTQVGEGGSSYVELVPPDGVTPGGFSISISGSPAAALDARAVVYASYLAPASPTVCQEFPITLQAQGRTSLYVPLSAGCRYGACQAR
jgi:hypothetical protein